MAITLKIY